MMKRITCLIAFVLAVHCFGHSFNEKAFQQKHKGIEKVIYEDGDVSYFPEKSYSFAIEGSQIKIGFTPRILIENKVKKIQIIFLSSKYPIKKLWIKHLNNWHEIPIRKNDVVDGSFRFIGEISLNDYIKFFHSGCIEIKFYMPQYKTKTIELENPPKTWKDAFKQMEVFFKIDKE